MIGGLEVKSQGKRERKSSDPWHKCRLIGESCSRQSAGREKAHKAAKTPFPNCKFLERGEGERRGEEGLTDK